MSEVEGRPAGTMSTERRYGIAISVALILGGFYWALTGLTEDTRSSAGGYPVQGESLLVQAGSAEVEVRAGNGAEVRVERRFERNLFGSDPKETYSDGKLQLRDTGCGFLSFGCGTHYVLSVPKDLQLTVESSSGDITVNGLPGGVNVKSSSGDIEASDIGDSLWLETSSGRLDARGLTASSVTTKTSSGSAELDFVTTPQSVEARSSSGDVSIRIPFGDQSYAVDTDTSSGDESVNVKTDPSAPRTIKAKTSSGDVTVDYNR